MIVWYLCFVRQLTSRPGTLVFLKKCARALPRCFDAHENAHRLLSRRRQRVKSTTSNCFDITHPRTLERLRFLIVDGRMQ